MKKNKEAYLNYVCPNCWNTLDKCICNLFPPYHLILIDQGIQEHIRVLNNKGYHTIGCCEGHRDVCISTYISFAQDYFTVEIELPKGFIYNANKRIIVHEYKSRNLTKDEFEEEKSQHIERLLLWCRKLPDLKC